MPAVIDTNVLVYDTFSDTLYHSEASSLLESLDTWIIPMIVIYEYTWFLKAASIDVRVIREKVMEYISDEKAYVTCESIVEIRWALNAVADEGLSAARFNDKVVLAVAARKGLPLASFDSKLRKQARRIGVEVLPRSLKRVEE